MSNIDRDIINKIRFWNPYTMLSIKEVFVIDESWRRIFFYYRNGGRIISKLVKNI